MIIIILIVIIVIMNVAVPYFTDVSSFIIIIITSHLGQSDKHFTSVPKIISIYFLHALTGQAL